MTYQETQILKTSGNGAMFIKMVNKCKVCYSYLWTFEIVIKTISNMFFIWNWHRNLTAELWQSSSKQKPCQC